MSKVDAWKALREEILQNLDIRAKYEEFGVKFTGKVSSKGWAECHAFGRDDKSPSAGVQLESGVYKDFTGDRLSIFDFMVANGIAPSWQEAQETLAKSVGLAKKIPRKGKAKRTADLLGFTNKVSLVSFVPLSRIYKIDPRVIEMTGARTARYPASSAEPQIVCAFPVYDPISMLETPPDSYILQATNGHPIMVYQGPDVPAKPEKRIVVGQTGILNKYALEHWEKAERVYKVEGLSDMLVLQDFIPEEFRERHIVITNACGADDGAPAWGLAAHCAGKEFVTIHDADIPGQFGTAKDHTGGAQRWVKAMKTSAKSVKNVQLPYEIASKHGKDLRDWIQTPGRKYADLLELVVATKDEVTGTTVDGTGAVTQRTPTELILDRLGIAALGHRADRAQSIIVFNFTMKRRFEIADIDKFTYAKALTAIGSMAKIELDPSPEPSPAKVSIKQLREAIAFEACNRRISRESAIGVGIWEINNKLIFVGSGEWMAMNGDLKSYQSPEIDDKLVDFGEGKESWYNEEEIRHWLPYATDPAWRSEFLKEFAGVFARWENWGVTPEENLTRSYMVAALALATWIQQVWTWRPWIAVIGETNAGKTAFFKVLHSYFGADLSLFIGSSTEAGLRQSIGTTSSVLLLDEFESNKERPKILDWLKNAGGGGSSVRGTPGQKSVRGFVKVLPWFGATEAHMKNETERNRYILFSLGSRKGKKWFSVPDADKCAEYRSKSLAILMRCWVRAKELSSVLVKNCAQPNMATRYTETHAVPIAMWAAVVGMTDEQAIELFHRVVDPMLSDIANFTSEDEHASLIGEILTANVDLGRGEKMLVSELLQAQSHKTSGDTPENILGRIGLRKMTGNQIKGSSFQDDERVLFIVPKMVQKSLLRHGDFADKGIDQLLKRIPRSFRTKQRVGGSSLRGIAIPMEEVIPFESMLKQREETVEAEGFVPSEHRSISVGDDLFS